MSLFKKSATAIIVLFLLMSGCSSITDEVKEAKEKAEETFHNKSKQSNEEFEGISYFLPSGYNVEEKTENNLILEKDSNPYILFVNPNEGPDSSLFFDTINEQKEEYTELVSFSETGRFGYISIKELEDAEYELAVGVGGVKMTTKTKKGVIAKNAEEMMEIVSSVSQ